MLKAQKDWSGGNGCQGKILMIKVINKNVHAEHFLLDRKVKIKLCGNKTTGLI